jgi:YD repeat-containing protein
MIHLAAAVALCLALLAPPGAAAGETERRYDAQGRFLGRAETRGDTTRFYDARGRYLGRGDRRGEDARFYDPRGRYTGRAEGDGARGGAVRYYDERGRFTGRADPSGDTLRRYDSGGRYQGRTERDGTGTATTTPGAAPPAGRSGADGPKGWLDRAARHPYNSYSKWALFCEPCSCFGAGRTASPSSSPLSCRWSA